MPKPSGIKAGANVATVSRREILPPVKVSICVSLAAIKARITGMTIPPPKNIRKSGIISLVKPIPENHSSKAKTGGTIPKALTTAINARMMTKSDISQRFAHAPALSNSRPGVEIIQFHNLIHPADYSRPEHLCNANYHQHQ